MALDVIMKSKEDRSLFGVVIRQQTKTGFFNLSDLQEAYNKAAELNGWSEKRWDKLLQSKDNQERIFYLLKKQGLINGQILPFMQLCENETPARLLKKVGAYITTGARETKTTWANPYLWFLLAMEMNPYLYAEVVVWLTDKLIINRIEAGNFYKALIAAIEKWNPDGSQYVQLAKGLNFIVFNKNEIGIRNIASSKELKELEDLEKKMAFAVEMNYITSFEMLISELRKLYTQKYKNLATIAQQNPDALTNGLSE